MSTDTLCIEVSLVRPDDHDGMTQCNDAPDVASGYGVYIRNPHALHVLDVNGGQDDGDGGMMTMREAHHRAFLFAGALAEHLGCNVVSSIAIGADYWWSRFVVVPQRDLLGAPGWSHDRETRFEECEEGEATQWAVFRLLARSDGRELQQYGDFDLVEDYPTRAAAEAAAAALDRGQPLPTPVWPPQPVAVVDIASDLAAVLERILQADCDTDAEAFAAAMRDGGVLLARTGVVVERA